MGQVMNNLTRNVEEVNRAENGENLQSSLLIGGVRDKATILDNQAD